MDIIAFISEHGNFILRMCILLIIGFGALAFDARDIWKSK